MKRRHFCQFAVATGMVVGFPFSSILAGTRIPADIPAVTLSGKETLLEKAAVKGFAEVLKGELLVKGDPAYDAARKVWNGRHDRHPALIARCADTNDVSKTVDFARERSLLSAVRGGGALIHDLDAASQAYGLATTTGVVSHIGIGGLTLSGGFGRLNRKFGMTIDNLLSADMVTADGKIRRVSAEENADLFWGIRGGGGNFGVVTAFEFALHPAGPGLLAGSVIWPISQARDVLELWAEYATGLWDDLYAAPFMVPGGDDEKGIVGMDILYAGGRREGVGAATPVRQSG